MIYLTHFYPRKLQVCTVLYLQMAVLEIQANGDAAVSKEAITNAGQSLEDALMRVGFIHSFIHSFIHAFIHW